MKFRFALGAAFLAALALRLATLSLTKIIDDAFMYMDVARTLGTTGRLSTSGIQPLYLLLVTPIYALLRPESVAELDAAGSACLVVGVLGDLLALALLARLLWHLGGPTASLVGAWIWALHPGTLDYATNGMETSWAFAAFLAVLLVSRRRRHLLTGLAVAVAMLARIDLAAVGAAAAAFLLWDSRDRPVAAVRPLAAMAAGWCLLYLPWLAFQFAQTGDLLPVSGLATHLLSEPHRATEVAELGLPYPVILFGLAVRISAFSAPVLAVCALPALTRVDLRELRLPLAAGLVVASFYVLVHGVSWYLSRYLAPILVVEVLVCALAAASLAPRLRVAAVGTALVYCAVLAALVVVRPTPFDYRAAALEVRGWSLQGRVAAPESGVLAYYLPGQVLNADGVLNRDAYAAMRQHRLAQYFVADGVDRAVLRRTAYEIMPSFSEPFTYTEEITGTRGFNLVKMSEGAPPFW